MQRVGTVLISVDNKTKAQKVNEIISEHSSLVLGRLGLPSSQKAALISLVIEGGIDEASSLTGKLGRVPGVQVKSVFLK